MKRVIVLVATAALVTGMLSAAGGSADAKPASPPRLEGRFVVKLTIVRHDITPRLIGRTFRDREVFAPQCPAPRGCVTTGPEGVDLHVSTHPLTYHGSTVTGGNCRKNIDGYRITLTERYRVRIVNVSTNRVRRFSGMDVVTYRRNKLGRMHPKLCPVGLAVARLHSVKKLT